MNSARLPRILCALLGEPWLIAPAWHKHLTTIVSAHAFGGAAELKQHAYAEGFDARESGPVVEVTGGIATIPVEGVLGRKFSGVLNSSGVTSTDVLEKEIRKAGNDPAVSAIVIAFDSPGGHTAGIEEACDAINEARKNKPVLAYADGLTDSAAYWLASQCDEIFATKSADVGCIGAYIAFLDQSRAAEMAGLRVELFKSGKYKAMGEPGTTLSDEQRELLQARVDTIANKFKTAVVAGRKRDISEDVMQGQSFSATDALAAGLIDSVADIGAVRREAARLANNSAKRGP